VSELKFETETYPRIWHSAYDAGVEARKQGLPRTCTLQGSLFCTPSGDILKVYLSAWNQGWDGYKIPEEFGHVEAALKNMPLRQCKPEDL
jgi:hypothetical protein